MAKRTQIQQKRSPHFTPTAATGMFKPRPFAEPVQPETATPEVQTKVELGNLEGDRLSRMSVETQNPVDTGKVGSLQAPPIQAKLTIGDPGDKYEQEADTIARKVVQQISAPTPPDANPNGDDGSVQRQFSAPSISRLVVQRREAVEGGEASSSLESTIGQARSGGVPLTAPIRRQMEGAFGADFSGVRIHANNTADTLNRDLSSRAFTTGNNIFFKRGEYDPGSSGGKELLAHELTHVVQQGGTQIQRQLVAPSAASSEIQVLEQAPTAIVQAKYSKLIPKVQKLIDELGIIIMGESLHEKSKNDIKKACKNFYAKKLLSVNAEALIYQICEDEKGREYLETKGFLSFSDVENYAKGKNFNTWENLSFTNRLQVASYQWNRQIKNTPGYAKGLSVNSRKQDIYKEDHKQWEKTLTGQGVNSKDPNVEKAQKSNAAVTNILQRIFIVLQKGLQYTDKKNGSDLKNWEQNVAVALSHGGRVLVKIPKVTNKGNKDDFFNWLTGGQSNRQLAGMGTRTFATHGFSHSNGKIKEDKGKGTAVAELFTSTKHYAMNVAGGGLGNLDINGNTILPDGSHGHLYIGYRPPTTDKEGGLLIGLETSEAGKTDFLGKEHNYKAQSSEFSSVMGLKTDKIGHDQGGRVVDLSAISEMESNWMKQLKQAETKILSGLVSASELVGERNQKLFDK